MKELTLNEIPEVSGAGAIAAVASLPLVPFALGIGLGIGGFNGFVLACQSYSKGEGLCQSAISGVSHWAKGAYLPVALVTSAYNW